jgi:tetratricopeptide (TPR) repeat protein
VETLSKRGYRFVCPLEEASLSPLASKYDGFLSDAQRACLTGRYLWNRRTATDLYSSIGYFEDALEIDGGCALAHVGLADASVLLGIWGLRSPDVAFGAGRRAAARALDLDPNLAEAHTALAEVLKGYEWDWCQAERHYQRALELKPAMRRRTSGARNSSSVSGAIRKPRRASSWRRRADPVSPAINAFLPYVYLAGESTAGLCRRRNAP